MATVFYESATELATLTNEFRVAGVLTDPSTVTLVVTSPSGEASTYTYAQSEITRVNTGIFSRDINCDESGLWAYVWTGTGAAADVQAGTWTVFSTALQKFYCSVEELKSRLGETRADYDFEFRLAVESASRSIDAHCNRHFWRGADTRTFVTDGSYTACIDDLVEVDELATDEAGDGSFSTVWSASDYQLLPLNPQAGPETRPYTKVQAINRLFPLYYMPGVRRDRLQIEGVFGWPQVPAAVRQAALLLAADAYKLKDAPFGIAGMGDLGVVRVRDNSRAAALLAPYCRYPAMVA